MGASPHHLQRLASERARRVVQDPPGTRVARFALTITGRPHGKERPRFGQGRAYTTDANRSHARRVQTEWIAAGRPCLAPDAWYAIRVYSYRRRPDGHYRRDGSLSAAGRRARFPGKPDVDNEAKAILDALVACGAIPDDRLCVRMTAGKWWDDRPERSAERDHVLVDVYEVACPAGGGAS